MLGINTKVVETNPCEDDSVTIRAVEAKGKYAIVKTGSNINLQYVIEPVNSLEALEQAIEEKFKFKAAMLDCCKHAIEVKFRRH